MKGKLTISSKNRLRNTLTIIQFVIAVLLITSTLVITSQIQFLRNLPLGYNKNEVISLPIGNEADPQQALTRMRSKLASVPQVVSVTGADNNLGRGLDGSSYNSVIGFDHNNRQIATNWFRVDYDYLKTLDIPLVAGRDFSNNFSTDTLSVIINEKMAAQLQEKDVVGTELALGEAYNLRVVGVVKDFNFKSLHQDIAPLTMVIHPEWPLRYIYIKVKPGNLPASIKTVEKAWKEIYPASKSEASFLDENTDRQYKKEEVIFTIFRSGAATTIFISCMGLFAIALLMITQRTKEIGIRKVLGAKIVNVVAMLLSSFIKLVFVAFLIAAPVAWFLMSKWLEDFAYRTDIKWWMIVGGGLIVMVVAAVTVSVHAIKAAVANPVKSLRTE